MTLRTPRRALVFAILFASLGLSSVGLVAVSAGASAHQPRMAIAQSANADGTSEAQATEEPILEEPTGEAMSVEVGTAHDTYRRALDREDPAARRASFRRAERLYGRAVESVDSSGAGPSAELLADWGNAALQAGDLGRAVLAYRRALSNDPDHRRARTNLGVVRRMVEPSAPVPRDLSEASLIERVQSTSANDLRLAAAIACLVAALLAGHHLRSPNSMIKGLAIVCAIVWVSLLALAWTRPAPLDGAVLSASETLVRTTDSSGAPLKFNRPLPAGVEVGIVEERAGWVQVEFADTTTGWVEAQSLTRIRGE